jgi:hypothetical protein
MKTIVILGEHEQDEFAHYDNVIECIKEYSELVMAK